MRVRVGLMRIVPPLQGLGVGWVPLTQAVGLGFVRSPLWGSQARPLGRRMASTAMRLVTLAGYADASCVLIGGLHFEPPLP